MGIHHLIEKTKWFILKVSIWMFFMTFPTRVLRTLLYYLILMKILDSRIYVIKHDRFAACSCYFNRFNQIAWDHRNILFSSFFTDPLNIAIKAKCNPCLSSPCKNNGTCNNDPVEFYRCTCPYGFKVRIELKIYKTLAQRVGLLLK